MTASDSILAADIKPLIAVTMIVLLKQGGCIEQGSSGGRYHLDYFLVNNVC